MRSQPNNVEIVVTITITIIAVGFNVDVAFVLINVVQENPYFGLYQKKEFENIFIEESLSHYENSQSQNGGINISLVKRFVV